MNEFILRVQARDLHSESYRLAGLPNLPSVSQVLDRVVAKFGLARDEWKSHVKRLIRAEVDALEVEPAPVWASAVLMAVATEAEPENVEHEAAEERRRRKHARRAARAAAAAAAAAHTSATEGDPE